MTNDERRQFFGVVEQARRDDEAATTVLRASNSVEYLCERDACDPVVLFVPRDSRQGWEQKLQCQHCNRRFEFPWVEWQFQCGRLLEVVDHARQGNQAAKMALVVILETERRPTILRKLSVGGVRPTDLPDGHHDVGLKVYEKIECLQVTRAYFKYEARIISDVCRRWRRNYRPLEVPLDIVFKELEGNHDLEEGLDEYAAGA
jgi:hypothetical protein